MFCICPQPNGFDPSTMGHFLESHVLEDDENCLRRPMTSMGVKGLSKHIQLVTVEVVINEHINKQFLPSAAFPNMSFKHRS